MAHILLVDDQRFMKEFLIYELTQMGHEASYVNDGTALFTFLEERIPDLLLIDPDINDSKGWELLREINRPGRPRTPILLFTSFGATVGDPRAVLADGFVIKNMNTQVLGEKILEVLSAREHPRQEPDPRPRKEKIEQNAHVDRGGSPTESLLVWSVRRCGGVHRIGDQP